jgi:hypothetical protein
MSVSGRVGALLAVLSVLLLAVVALSQVPGVGGRIAQAALLVGMAVVLALMVAAD